jgi:hypothetical protein
VSQLFPGAPINFHGYTRFSPNVATDPNTPAGKIMIEIDPINSYTVIPTDRRFINQWGGYRLWVDGTNAQRGAFFVATVQNHMGLQKRVATTGTCHLAKAFTDRPAGLVDPPTDKSAAEPTSPGKSAPEKATA